MRKFNQNDKTGFTLIEMLVSIFIIMLISTIFIVNYISVSKSSELSIIAQKLISDTRFAQNQALGLSEFNGSAPNGWGVHMMDNGVGYIIFADTNNDDIYNLGFAAEGYKQVALPDGVRVSLPGGVGRYDILFIPPEPITKITENSIPPLSSSATITLTDGSNAKIVFINFFGLVEAQ